MEDTAMPMRKTSMEKIREIVRLKENAKLSDRAISRALKISRPVIKQYLVQIEKSGLKYDEIKEMDDESFHEILSGDNPCKSERYQILSDKFPYFVKELKRTGVTLQLLWEEYRQEHPGGYQYSQFCYHFQEWRDASEISAVIEHKAGDKMFVDYAGEKLPIVDRYTGAIQWAEIFVAVLGASQRTYLEATKTQQKHDWISANQNAFQYFGGVTNAIVPDCFKVAVIKGNKYEPDINPEYMDFARHYNTVILPTRPASPKDKPLVEGAIRIVYAWIFARIRNRIFHSLEELNIALWEELEKYNNKPMQKMKVSRNDLFSDIEKAALKPLPNEKYVIRHFKLLTAQVNYHIYLREDDHYYSVPYRLRRKKITAIYDDKIIELFYGHRRIAFHKRESDPYKRYTTLKEHMPPNHQFVNDWNPQRFINWADNIGGYVRLMVEQILARQQHPEQAYKVCLGILNLPKKYSDQRLNKACKRAIEFDCYSYKAVKNILEKQLEDSQPDVFKTIADHVNIRGNAYYR
jgi:transposase